MTSSKRLRAQNNTKMTSVIRPTPATVIRYAQKQPAARLRDFHQALPMYPPLIFAHLMRLPSAEICDFGQTSFINLFAVSESWLGPTIPDSMLSLPGFQPYRKGRNASGRGVCFFIKNDLPCRHRTDLEFLGLELIWIKVFLISFSILVGCCHRPPSSATVFYDLLEKWLDAASK